jgi:hypothetical protein
LSEKKELWRIKHRAKWSHNLREKKEAIMELSFHGEKAIPYLEEILNATNYDEVRTACAEAIKAIKSKAIGTSASATAAES